MYNHNFADLNESKVRQLELLTLFSGGIGHSYYAVGYLTGGNAYHGFEYTVHPEKFYDKSVACEFLQEEKIRLYDKGASPYLIENLNKSGFGEALLKSRMVEKDNRGLSNGQFVEKSNALDYDQNRTYSYSTNQEHFVGHFESAESAAITAFNDIPDIDSVEVGVNNILTAHAFVKAREILQVISDNACDKGPEQAADWLHNDLMKNKEKCAELEKLIGDWIEEQEPVNFFSVDEIVNYDRDFFESPSSSMS